MKENLDSVRKALCTFFYDDINPHHDPHEPTDPHNAQPNPNMKVYFVQTEIFRLGCIAAEYLSFAKIEVDGCCHSRKPMYWVTDQQGNVWGNCSCR